MSTPQQYTLAIEHPHEQRLDNFVRGRNRELVDSLLYGAAGFQGLWIYGERSSGRSHLLRGACLAAQTRMQAIVYVGCEAYRNDHVGLESALIHAGREGETVAIDDIGMLCGEQRWEELLMLIYQRLVMQKGRFIVSHDAAANTLNFAIPDLASRLQSLQHFWIEPLRDEDKAQLLRQRAHAAGYDLSQAVLDYWMVRGPRDLGALLTDLDVLDRASLMHKQKVTIPLLKQVLGY